MPKAIKSKGIRYVLTITEELKSWIQEQADLENRSLNNYIITILKKHEEEVKKEKSNRNKSD
jgi:predicted HicB family RNase H-like nuclease